MRKLLALALLATVGALPASASPPPPQFAGTWDMTWQTRKGPSQQGYMAIVQTGKELSVRIHGKGSVKAKGTATENRFRVKGSRMAVPYVIAGSIDGDRMSGSLKVLSVDKPFTAVRRTR